MLIGTLIVFLSSGCGGEPSRSAVPVEDATTSTQALPPTATGSGPTGVTPAPAGASGPTGAPAPQTGSTVSPGGAAAEAVPGGAGDEEPIRTEATFVVDGAGNVTPASISVPPFFAVELAVVSDDGAPHEIKLVGTDVAFTLRAGARVVRRIDGLQPGMYALLVDGGAGAGSLVVGDEAGP